jgi:hypothetical protein
MIRMFKCLISCQGNFANIVTSQITTTDRVMLRRSHCLYVIQNPGANDPFSFFQIPKLISREKVPSPLRAIDILILS